MVVRIVTSHKRLSHLEKEKNRPTSARVQLGGQCDCTATVLLFLPRNSKSLFTHGPTWI
jgi:hypothetical protein